MLMRKIYTFLLLLTVSLLLSVSATSQQVISEDFESYENGAYMATANPTQWEAWGSGVLGGLVSDEQAHNGNNAMKVYINGSTETDVVLKMNDLTTGRYRVEFYMYVPSGKTGYYNMLQDFNGSNSQWGIQLTFNNGTVSIDANGSVYTHPYTQNGWTKIQHFIDLDNDWIDFYLDDEIVLSYQWSKGTNGDGTMCKLDAIDFYSHTANNQPGLYYIDDLVVEQAPAPAAPTSLTATVQNENDIQLNWTGVENEDLVYYSISREGEEIATTTETSYTDAHLYPMTYNYQVRAYCGTAIGYSAASNTAQAVVEGGVEREKVLIEAFSYKSCGYCPYAAKALDQLEAEGNLDIIVLDHHISDTYGYDQSANRFNYWVGKNNMFGQLYDFSGTPSMVFDGYVGMGGLASQNNTEEKQYITSFYNYVKAINSIYNLNAEIAQTEVGSRTFTLNVTAEKLSEYFGNDQITVIAALTEDNDYNWGVAHKISNLVRVLYPNCNGRTATFDENNRFSTNFTITVSGSYDISKCKVVVWVENHTQGRVMQSIQFKLSDYYENSVAEENISFNVYPNPSNGIFTIEGDIESYEIYDVTGKLVMQESVNTDNTTIDLTNYAKGIYTLKTLVGNKVKVDKLIVE